MEIIVVGLNHRTAPIEIRERLSIPEAQIQDALIRLKACHGIEEGLLLSTCNRVEVCALVPQAQAGFQRVREFFEDHHEGNIPVDWTSALYHFSSDDAIRHIFRVASSLDSMVVGEPQILGQLKDAFEVAMQQKATGVVLNKIFRKAISVAKRVRTETKIAENAVSISFAAVELAKKVFGSLEGKEVLLVGAGEMAELALRHLIDSGARKVMITTRNYDNALELSRRFEGIPVRLEDFPRHMPEADILVCSTGALNYVVTEAHVRQAIERRRNRPMFMIDISVPRNIDPLANRVDNVYLYDIDDLQSIVESNMEERQKEALKAEGLVSEELEALKKWLKSLEVVPTITALKAQAEEIRQVEVNKTLSRLKGLSDEHREMIEYLATSIVNKILHSPLVTLKDEAHSSNGLMYVEVVRRLFNLDKESSGRAETGRDPKDRDSGETGKDDKDP
ncbi:MAG TPA: glutamyl-tRNA reductase [Nitrospiria bacterium]